jgi:hypothetical protein
MNYERAILHALKAKYDAVAGNAGLQGDSLTLPVGAAMLGTALPTDKRVAVPFTALFLLDAAGNPIPWATLSDIGSTAPTVGELPGVVARLQAANLNADAPNQVYDQLVIHTATLHRAPYKANILAVAAKLGDWSIHSDPAAGAQASATKAASGLGSSHVLTSICATLSAGAAASGIVKLYVRDGAAGAGPIIWSANLQVPAAGHGRIVLTDLGIAGSSNTALTVEFAAAAGAGSQENISATGYTAID